MTAIRQQLLFAAGLMVVPAVLFGAEADTDPGRQTQPHEIVKRITFENGSGGVLPSFTDYSLETSGFDFLAEIRSLPAEVRVPSRNRRAYYLEGNNHSDDLFMYWKVPVLNADGLVANQAYRLSFDIELASRSTDCVGVGGSEDAVYLKAGGSTLEPVPLLLNNEFVSISIDKGNQSTGGTALGVIGSIWNGKPCGDSQWILLHRTYNHPYPVVASSNQSMAQIWVAVGTDSAFEAVTGVYYYSITARLTPVTH